VRRLVVYFSAFLVVNAALIANTFSLSFYQNMTDNVFQNRYSERDQLSSLNFYLDKDFSKVSIFTEGNYAYLYDNPGLSYYFHDAGLDYLHALNEKTAFYFSVVGQGAFYRSDYSDFNYLSLHFLGAFKTYLSQTSILKSNYAFEYKGYSYSLFDFISHFLDVSFDTYFQTKTTIKAEVSWGYKYYLHPDASQEAVIEEGQGYRGGRDSYIYIPRTVYEGKAIQIFSANGLIAQGLGGKIGLSLSGMKQWTLSGENPFTSVEEFYVVENPSYDSFSWEGYQVSSQLTILVPWNIELKMGYTRSEKEFPGIESMDLEGNPLGVTRQDTRDVFEARVEKDFSSFSLFLSYFYVNNRSNDPFFDWQGNFFSAGLEWNVFFGGKK